MPDDVDPTAPASDPLDRERLYANYLKTCAMSGVKPVSRERALGLIQGPKCWRGAQTDDAMAAGNENGLDGPILVGATDLPTDKLPWWAPGDRGLPQVHNQPCA